MAKYQKSAILRIWTGNRDTTCVLNSKVWRTLFSPIAGHWRGGFIRDWRYSGLSDDYVTTLFKPFLS
jgi:hypothetical protein